MAKKPPNNKISINIEFKYGEDKDLDVDVALPSGLRLIPDGSRVIDVFSRCGWFKAWGKELSGVDITLPGGSGFIGDWVGVRKDLTWMAHPHHPTVLVPKRIDIIYKARHIDEMPNSPIVIAFSLVGFQYALLVHKQTAAAPAYLMQQVGRTFGSTVTVGNLLLPYPANAGWADTKASSGNCTVSAKQHLMVGAVVTVNTHNLLHGFGLCKQPLGKNELLHPIPVKASTLIDDPLLDGMLSAHSPFGGIVVLCDSAVAFGSMSFDVTPENKTSSPTQEKLKKTLVEFVPPEGLELPTAPEGFRWLLNIRGILLLEDMGRRDGQPVFPEEVFELDVIYEEIAALQDKGSNGCDVIIQRHVEEIKKIKTMFRHMEGVGVGITMNSRIFGDLDDD